MKLHRPYTLDELVQITNAQASGDLSLSATGINEIHVAGAGDIVFVDHPKYYDSTLASAASVVLIDKMVECPDGKALLQVDDPFAWFNALGQRFKQESEQNHDPVPTIHDSAVVMQGAQIGRYVRIGAGTVIHSGAVIYDHCVIGDDVTIHANAVIGSDAFYFKRRPQKHDKMLSIGNVVIEDEVEIGAGCSIDRGVTSSTRIGRGTKLDNHVHIGHDTVIGERCLLAAQVGIAGCVTLEDEVIFWGQVGCIANVTIGKGVEVYAQSGITKSLEAGRKYFGSPAGPAKTKMRELAALSRLGRTP
jgi:UDP-3-O-[3-hydroxymyristoyl] glucosamine N-acyltransferase